MQAAGCWALCNLSEEEDHKEQIVALGALAGAVDALRFHPAETGLARSACRLLRNLMTGTRAALADAPPRYAAFAALWQPCLSGSPRYPRGNEVGSLRAHALGRGGAGENSSERRIQMMKSNVVRWITGALHANVNDAGVQAYGLWAAALLMRHSELARQNAFELGAMEIAVWPLSPARSVLERQPSDLCTTRA